MKLKLEALLKPARKLLEDRVADMVISEHVGPLARLLTSMEPGIPRERAEAVVGALLRRLVERIL